MIRFVKVTFFRLSLCECACACGTHTTYLCCCGLQVRLAGCTVAVLPPNKKGTRWPFAVQPGATTLLKLAVEREEERQEWVHCLTAKMAQLGEKRERGGGQQLGEQGKEGERQQLGGSKSEGDESGRADFDLYYVCLSEHACCTIV